MRYGSLASPFPPLPHRTHFRRSRIVIQVIAWLMIHAPGGAASPEAARALTGAANLRVDTPLALRSKAGSRPAYSSSSSPLSRSNSLASAGTTPMAALAAGGSCHTSMPLIRIWPLSGRSSPVIIDSDVVLPAPFGPTSPASEPAAPSGVLICCLPVGPPCEYALLGKAIAQCRYQSSRAHIERRESGPEFIHHVAEASPVSDVAEGQ